MLRRTIIVFAATLLPLTAGAQAPPPPAAKETPRETKDAPRSYVPGLEQFMNVILIEHNKLWFAAAAQLAICCIRARRDQGDHGRRSGARADFQKSASRGHARCRHHQGNRHLEKAIEAKDFKAFTAGYDKLTAACNACHQGPKTDSSLSSGQRSRPSPIRTIGHTNKRAP